MRTTWIILAIMLLAGAGLYFYFTQKQAPGSSDTIKLVNTPDSIVQKTQILIADAPFEVFFRDSSWQYSDSALLRKIGTTAGNDTMNKNYHERTIFISYDNKWFFDMPVKKADTTIGYDFTFELKPQNDSMIVVGTIDQKAKGKFKFANAMMKMYQSFVITYNEKMPDSLRNDSLPPPEGPAPTKTITVLKP